MTTKTKAVQILDPTTGEPVTVSITPHGAHLMTMQFPCGSTALLTATYVRKCIQTAKRQRRTQEAK